MTAITMNEFQQRTADLSTYNNLLHPYLSLCSSAGMIAQAMSEPMVKLSTAAEAQTSVQDLLQYVLLDVAEICSQNGWHLGTIAERVVREHEQRKAIHGTHTEGVDVRSVQAQD